jgi:hypothetical protein
MPLIDSDGASAQQNLAEDDGTEFSEPEIPYGAKYPHNHVYESEAGHLKEYDDTPNKERIHERHSTGTGYEIDEFGTKVQRVKKDNYQLISGDHYELIKGSSNVTINKGSRLFVNAGAGKDQHFTIQIGENGNLNLQVDAGKINIHNVQGDINMKAGGSINLEAGAHIRMKATDYATTVSGDMNEEVQGKNRKTGKPIDLNPA